MATFTYQSFTGKQGVLIGYGGGWACTGFGSPCTQDASNNHYGPITATGTSGGMYLEATINLAATEFVGATSMAYTIKWQAVATSQGGNPTPIIIWTWGGLLPADRFPDPLPYNTVDGTSATHGSLYGVRPSSISLSISADISNFGGASVTIAFSGISFEIHDVVYGATSTTTTPVSSSIAGSSLSSTSSTSTSILATNSTTSLTSSTSFTTTISGHATVIQTIPSQSLPASESLSHTPLPSNSSGSPPMTVAERAGIVLGSLVSVALVLIGIAFYYQWSRRRRTILSEETPYSDGQSGTSPDTRMTSREPWTAYPYRKQPYSLPTTIDVRVSPEEQEETETSEMELVQPRRRDTHSQWRTEEDGSSVHVLGPPPPAYSQLSPRLNTRALSSSVSTEED